MGPNQSRLYPLAGDPNDPHALPPPSSPADFRFLKILGKGTFATVYLAQRIEDEEIYAIKVLDKRQIVELNEVEHTIAERAILAELNHPFLMTLYAAFQTQESLYLVLEYIPGGELFFHLRKRGCFSEAQVRFYAAQIVLALEYLHNKGIVIRDLKPENILLMRSGYIKITDFGLSKQNLTSTLGASTFAGTAEYLAPETLRNAGHGKGVDWWSLGTIVYELITGTPPFFDRDKKVMYRNIIHKQPRFPSYISDACRDFITGCLVKDPRKRLGCRKDAGGVAEAKKHPWFKSLDWDKLYRMQYPMEYRPEVKNLMDLSNFDGCFTETTFDQEELEGKKFRREHGDETLGGDIFKGFNEVVDPKEAADGTEAEAVGAPEIGGGTPAGATGAPGAPGASGSAQELHPDQADQQGFQYHGVDEAAPEPEDQGARIVVEDVEDDLPPPPEDD